MLHLLRSVFLRPLVAMSSSSALPAYVPRYITPSELHALLSNAVSRDKTLVVDVRDDDREGGHVSGSMHVASRGFSQAIDEIEQAGEGKELIVFHCMHSQQRGPGCAAFMASQVRARAAQHAAAAAASGAEAPATFPPIAILEGGFVGWAKYVSRLTAEEKKKGAPLLEAYCKDTHGYDA